MLQTLQFVSGVPLEKMVYVCEGMKDNKNKLHVAFGLYGDEEFKEFTLACDGSPDDEGLARGIRLTPNDIKVLKEGWQ